MILREIVKQKYHEVTAAKKIIPEDTLKKNLQVKRNNSFKKALLQEGISLIAEVKKASPSRGIFRKDFDPVEIASHYENAGAAAISVITDQKFFRGSLEDLKKVKTKVKLPVLRKDFIIDSYQIYETAHAGADAVLLITAVLKENDLKNYIRLADDLGLHVLVEVHSREELARALQCGAEIIGINNRDLTNFTTDISTTFKLAAEVPKDRILVSESGIKSGEDVRKLAAAGVDAVLVGEALIRSSDITAKIGDLLGLAKGEKKWSG